MKYHHPKKTRFGDVVQNIRQPYFRHLKLDGQGTDEESLEQLRIARDNAKRLAKLLDEEYRLYQYSHKI